MTFYIKNINLHRRRIAQGDLPVFSAGGNSKKDYEILGVSPQSNIDEIKMNSWDLLKSGSILSAIGYQLLFSL